MNTIDDMDATAEALKAAGDDIAAARLDRVRRDRIRGAITQAAADAALHVAKRHLAELVEPPRPVESVFDLLRTERELRLTPDPGADMRSESSAFAQRTPVERRRTLPHRRTFGKRIEAKPYEGGGYHSTGMTLAELRGLVATLTQAGCPEERFVKIRTTDGNPPELVIDAGGWMVEP